MPSRTAFAPGPLPISRSSFGLLVPNKCSDPLKIVGGWHSQLDARNPLNSLTVLLDPFDSCYLSSTISIEWHLVLHNVFDRLPDSESCLPMSCHQSSGSLRQTAGCRSWQIGEQSNLSAGSSRRARRLARSVAVRQATRTPWPSVLPRLGQPNVPCGLHHQQRHRRCQTSPVPIAGQTRSASWSPDSPGRARFRESGRHPLLFLAWLSIARTEQLVPW